MPNIAHALKGVKTNTRRTKAYDNIVFNRRATAEFISRAAVFDLMKEFNLTEQQPLTISDHMPIWAEFSVHESGSR